MSDEQIFTEKEKAFLAGRAFSKNVLGFYPAFSLKDIENAFEAGVKFGRDVMNCPSCSEYLESLRGNKGEATKEMSKHFEPDIWSKIMANYKPSFHLGYSIGEACEKYEPSDFLNYAFEWRESPEGHNYWDDICDSLIEKGL